jgi:hypothetical protein
MAIQSPHGDNYSDRECFKWVACLRAPGPSTNASHLGRFYFGLPDTLNTCVVKPDERYEPISFYSVWCNIGRTTYGRRVARCINQPNDMSACYGAMCNHSQLHLQFDLHRFFHRWEAPAALCKQGNKQPVALSTSSSAKF